MTFRLTGHASPRCAPTATCRIADYALIGDGHTAALVGRDGSIDWLCLPRFDAAPVFDRILDAEDGGRFELQPVEPFEAVRRYREHTNVLETMFKTASGSVRVTDAMTARLRPAGADPRRRRARRPCARCSWRFEPRYGRRASASLGRRARRRGSSSAPAARATFVIAASPPTRDDAERRLERTAATGWTGAVALEYDGRWREPVLRSALTLKLLTFAPTGAIVAAPTTSLPERIGGDRNWDYRFSWLRDGIYTMRALLLLGYRDEAESFFRWQLEAIEPDLPEVKPLYRIDGSSDARERELDLPGYRGSRPVATATRRRPSSSSTCSGTCSRARRGSVPRRASLDPAAGRALAQLADFVADSWRRQDAGIWEVRDGLSDFVQSKAMCWTALDRAAELAEAGAIPGGGSPLARGGRRPVRAWIESEGWSEELGSYVRAPELGDEVDASLALLRSAPTRAPPTALSRDGGHDQARARRRWAAALPRPAARESEGAFLTCSFWLVDALGRAGRTEEGHELMAELIALANDVGLYGEEIDPETGEHLGNFPQGLVHLALVNAAVSLEERGLALALPRGARSSRSAVLTRPMCENACGKLPTSRPSSGSYSSDEQPELVPERRAAARTSRAPRRARRAGRGCRRTRRSRGRTRPRPAAARRPPRPPRRAGSAGRSRPTSSSRRTASSVPRTRGSSAGRKPKSGIVSRLASSALRAVGLDERAELVVEAALEHLGVDLVPHATPPLDRRPRARAPRPAAAPRSNATHAITFECVKWRRGPRTSQIPSSGSRQRRLEVREQLPRRAPTPSSSGRQAAPARLVEHVEHLAVDVELELRAGAVADPNGPSSPRSRRARPARARAGAARRRART